MADLVVFVVTAHLLSIVDGCCCGGVVGFLWLVTGCADVLMRCDAAAMLMRARTVHEFLFEPRKTHKLLFTMVKNESRRMCSQTVATN